MTVVHGPPIARAPSYTGPTRRDDASISDDAVRRSAVLILSSDPLAAALLGAAVELAGHLPHFPQEHEPPRSALLRVRPRLVLVDCDHEEACAEGFIGPALMTDARVLCFRARKSARDVAELCSRLGVRVLDLPAEHAELGREISALLAE